MSRAPFFMSIFGYTLARGGRATEAYQLLAELDERALCGEFIPAFSRLGACMGLGDMDGVRRELTIAVSKAMPPSRLWVPSMPLLGESRTNPEVAGCSMRGIAGSMPVQQLWELCRYARFRDRPDDGPANAQPCHSLTRAERHGATPASWSFEQGTHPGEAKSAVAQRPTASAPDKSPEVW